MMKQPPRVDPRQQQTEILQGLGQILQATRTEKGLSLETIAERTRISVRQLGAIEAGQLAQLPEPVYVRGLLQQYAECLGLNGREFVREFPTAAIAPPCQPSQHLSGTPLRPLHLYILYIAVVVLSVRGLSGIIQRSFYQEPLYSVPLPQLPSPAPTATESPAQTVAATPSKPAHPVVLEMALEQSSWLRVVVDGQTEFEGLLKAGDRRTWVARERLTLRVGNAGGVVVSFNEQNPHPLGAPGQVREVTYQAR